MCKSVIGSVRLSIVKPKSLGFRGEDFAAHYLQSKGYQIVANNFTIQGGEIDLIAKSGHTLVFVEVKTRTSDLFGRGEESLNAAKRKRIGKSIGRYLQKNRLEDCDYRFDLIDVELHPETNDVKNITHFQDIEI